MRLRSPYRSWPSLLSSGCSGRRGIEQTPPPGWVNERPVSSLYYIGIGSAALNPIPGEALRTAKERAAADLAGEIALRVESTSLLESEERNGEVQRTYSNTITSRAEERIAGFQVVDVWQGRKAASSTTGWTRPATPRSGNARRQDAIDMALLEHEAGKSDLSAGNRVPGALNHWGAGVLGLEEFWNEVNRATLDGGEVSIEPPPPARHAGSHQQHRPAAAVTVSLSPKETFNSPSACTQRWKEAMCVRGSPSVPLPQRHLHEESHGVHR